VRSDADHHLPWLAEPNVVARQLLALVEAL